MKYIVEISKNGQATISPLATPSITSMVKELEKALPKGEMVVVGNSPTPTEKNIADLKAFVALYDKSSCKCGCRCGCKSDALFTEEEVDEYAEEAYERGREEGYEAGHSDGYSEGYSDCQSEYEEAEENVEEALDRVKDILAEVGLI